MGRLGRMKTVIQYELQICGSINLNAPNKAVVASLDAAFPSSPTNLQCTSGEGEEEPEAEASGCQRHRNYLW